MIKCTKSMKRDAGQYEGTCSFCTSKYEADQDDMIQVGDGRNGVMIKRTDCSQCDKSGTVVWECVKALSYTETTRLFSVTRKTQDDDMSEFERHCRAEGYINTDDGPMGLSRAYSGRGGRNA